MPISKGSGIFVRDGGRTKQITREEWDLRLHGCEPVIIRPMDEPYDEMFAANITHNLIAMAIKAHVYMPCWRPEEIGITNAKQLIEPLQAGLSAMEADPERFKKLNPQNGWGDYNGFLMFVSEYLQACRDYPDAEIRVSR